MERILIVDGSNLLFQMFYGLPRKIYNSKGETIHGTIGFIGALFKIINRIKPNYSIVVFDSDSQLQRRELDENYKQNRTIDWNSLPPDEVPFFEIPKIKTVLNKLNIYNIEAENIEADDLISAITKEFKNYNITISSFDSDFFQLINENVEILRYRGENSIIYNLEYFINKFGFHPRQYLFYKSLVGDTADNIKGITQVGPKRATQLVKRFNNYQEIIDNINDVSPNCIRKYLLAEANRFELNMKLIAFNNHKSNIKLKNISFSKLCYQKTSNTLLREFGIFN